MFSLRSKPIASCVLARERRPGSRRVGCLSQLMPPPTGGAARGPRCFFVLSIVMVLAATLLPSEPGGEVHWNQTFCVLCGKASLADGFANLVLFLPLGVALGLQGYAPLRALLFAATVSLSVELAQFAVPGRDPNLGDFTLGAALGGGLLRSARLWASPGLRVASRLSLVAARVKTQPCDFRHSAVLTRKTEPVRLRSLGSPR